MGKYCVVEKNFIENHAGSKARNDIADIPYWSANTTYYSWYYAGVAGNTTNGYYAHISSYIDGGQTVLQYKFDSSGAGGQYCKNNWPNYTTSNTTHTIYYRPRIRVKYT